eukprot:8105795-Prorocentrum_lima.AAC.1
MARHQAIRQGVMTQEGNLIRSNDAVELESRGRHRVQPERNRFRRKKVYQQQQHMAQREPQRANTEEQ